MSRGFKNYKFVIDSDGVIFKKCVDKDYLFLKMTHWRSGEDRRIYQDNGYKHINSNKALFLINKYWDETDCSWVHNGVHYKVFKKDQYKNREKIILSSPRHNKSKWSDGDFLVFNKGKLYYLDTPIYYFPKCWLKSLDGKTSTWADIKHLKPVFNDDNKCFV